MLPIPPGTHWGDVMPPVLPGTGDAGQVALPTEKPKRRAAKPEVAPPPPLPTTIRSGGLRFSAPAPVEAPTEKVEREANVREKNDPRLVAAARELRDRWLEQVAAEPWRLEARGRYDVTRALPAARAVSEQRQLPAAA